MADLILAKLFKKQGFHSDRSHCKTVSRSVCLSDVATVTKGGRGLSTGQLKIMHYEHSAVSALISLAPGTQMIFIFVSTLEVETSNPEGAHLT